MRRDALHEDRGKDPKHHQAKAGHADGAVEQLAVKTEAAFESDGEREKHHKPDPHRGQPRGHCPDDARALRIVQNDPADDMADADQQEHQHRIAHRHQRIIDRPALEAERVIGIDHHLAGAHAAQAQRDIHHEGGREHDHRGKHDRVEKKTDFTGP